MSRPISIILLIGGIVLLIYGAGASGSAGSSVSRAFTGAPTDKTIWLLLGGFAAAVLGVAGLLRGPRPK